MLWARVGCARLNQRGRVYTRTDGWGRSAEEDIAVVVPARGRRDGTGTVWVLHLDARIGMRKSTSSTNPTHRQGR